MLCCGQRGMHKFSGNNAVYGLGAPAWVIFASTGPSSIHVRLLLSSFESCLSSKPWVSTESVAFM